MDWKYKGSTFLLTLYRHDRIQSSKKKARKYDYWHVDFEGESSCFPKVNWQIRRAYILEGTAKDPNDKVQKRMFYLDAQTFTPAFGKYITSLENFKFLINSYAHLTPTSWKTTKVVHQFLQHFLRSIL